MSPSSLMDTLLQTLASPGWRDLVHALLHSLWLGVAWAALLSLGFRLCARANVRYALSLLALAGLITSTVAAWALPKVQRTELNTGSVAAEHSTAIVLYDRRTEAVATSSVESPPASLPPRACSPDRPLGCWLEILFSVRDPGS